MYKRNAARTGVLAPTAYATPQEFNLVAGKGQEGKHLLELNLYADFGTLNWQVSSNRPDRISFSSTTGVVSDQTNIAVYVTVPGNLTLGENHLGNINVTFSQGNGYNKSETIPVSVNMLQKLHQDYLPMVR